MGLCVDELEMRLGVGDFAMDAHRWLSTILRFTAESSRINFLAFDLFDAFIEREGFGADAALERRVLLRLTGGEVLTAG